LPKTIVLDGAIRMANFWRKNTTQRVLR
jgi:hypothetical protein